MNCLILAAGIGSRLRDHSDSKPLTLLSGRPLIEHVIERAIAGGATAFTIVTGYRAAPLEAFLSRLAADIGVPIHCVRITDWERPNGHSVLAGSAALAGDFLLLMSDHLFDPTIVRQLLAAERGEAALVLAVDRDVAGPLLDLDDATRVETENGRIIRIGKALTRFDAIDTGIFRAGAELPEAIRAAIAAGAGGSLSDGVQWLADRSAATVLDVTGAGWIDVDDGRMLALAETFIAQR
jgi:1L-myo-inositol 1-phosphate cytidylyltransferase